MLGDIPVVTIVFMSCGGMTRASTSPSRAGVDAAWLAGLILGIPAMRLDPARGNR